MIVFSAIVPHPPPLVPTVGKEHAAKLTKTIAAFQSLEQDLYVTHPDTLLIISPHGEMLADAFTIQLAAEYKVSFAQFGDHRSKASFKTEYQLIDKIQRALRGKVPLHLGTKEELDYGVSIPLVRLAAHLPGVSVVPVVTSGLDYKAHYDFGRALKDELANSLKRIAIIASADLSHTRSDQAPGGFSKLGSSLDEKVIELINARNVAGMLTLDRKLTTSAKECGLRAMMIMFGAIERMNFEPKILSHESPFGVGYLVAELSLT